MKQIKIVDQAQADFHQAVEQLLCAFIDKYGAGQVMEHLISSKGRGEITDERRAWVLPLPETDLIVRRVEELKEREGDRFRTWVGLYYRACNLSPRQAQVVQYRKDGKFVTLFRLRDDVAMGVS